MRTKFNSNIPDTDPTRGFAWFHKKRNFYGSNIMYVILSTTYLLFWNSTQSKESQTEKLINFDMGAEDDFHYERQDVFYTSRFNLVRMSKRV